MDEATQYLREIGDLASYYDTDPPKKRLRGIYRTSRHNMSTTDAAQLWDCLMPLRPENGRPSSPRDFDDAVIDAALAVDRRLRDLGCCASFGIGQKVANLYMKDQWALGLVDDVEGLLHAPLDRIVLRRIPNRHAIAPSWEAWTKVPALDRNAPSVQEYVKLQQAMRSLASESGTTAICLEQRWWHEGRV